MDPGRADHALRPASVIDPDPLDSLLGRWHWRSRHTASVAAPPAAAFAAAHAVTLAELPATATRSRCDRGSGLLDDLAAQGFVPLAEPEALVLVLGRIGHLWQTGGRPTDADDFASFHEPGYAKAVLLLAARPFGAETMLVAESRVLATDEQTLEGFSRQWLVAAWSSRLPHLDVFAAVRARLGVARHTDRPPAA